MYEEVTKTYAVEKMKEGKSISSVFTVWQGEGTELKGRLVVNLHRQNQHWEKGHIKMEKISSFYRYGKGGLHVLL